jgi:hypothetical protein
MTPISFINLLFPYPIFPGLLYRQAFSPPRKVAPESSARKYIILKSLITLILTKGDFTCRPYLLHGCKVQRRLLHRCSDLKQSPLLELSSNLPDSQARAYLNGSPNLGGSKRKNETHVHDQSEGLERYQRPMSLLRTDLKRVQICPIYEGNGRSMANRRSSFFASPPQWTD